MPPSFAIALHQSFDGFWQEASFINENLPICHIYGEVRLQFQVIHVNKKVIRISLYTGICFMADYPKSLCWRYKDRRLHGDEQIGSSPKWPHHTSVNNEPLAKVCGLLSTEIRQPLPSEMTNWQICNIYRRVSWQFVFNSFIYSDYKIQPGAPEWTLLQIIKRVYFGVTITGCYVTITILGLLQEVYSPQEDRMPVNSYASQGFAAH